MLYIFWFLHQTTTWYNIVVLSGLLYIFWFLHQTTTIIECTIHESELYIFWFLHQTTTCSHPDFVPLGCISFDSYIKPQPTASLGRLWWVVYLLIPTSNHNLLQEVIMMKMLYIFWFLHQTTTYRWIWYIITALYIFWFLHQTTTVFVSIMFYICCISFDSYIKPQPSPYRARHRICCISFDSYIKPQRNLFSV